jgi:propionyl-CoA carboxylase alpha chain
MPELKKILIANRGEIAIRVMQTARRLNIKTVAVYSDVDRHADHVAFADEAYALGGTTSAESYLQIPKIMEAIKETGADAVHPGYGFLSENAEFSKTLKDNNIEFIGPNEHAINSMGDKIESMRIAEQAGVSCAKRFDGQVDTTEHAMEIAAGIGYPIIMKASAGGGGKGMRIAWTEEELKEGYHLAKTEAAASFGDDRMLIQQFVCPYESRHIEIQIIGDKHGNYAAFPERECSIQRRNQKVLEESPSTLLSAETRKKMQEQAIMLCKSVGYHSAGTVEFIADNEENFYFLEMNTRLQVEHPVTEMVTGVDLVEQMIRVSSGLELPKELQGSVPYEGWSMEARVYAECPFRNFLPSIGPLVTYQEPTNVRVDSGVSLGGEISMYYDPMISKVIAGGKDRKESIANLASALDAYQIGDISHNIPFIQDVCRTDRYIEGNICTEYIQEEYPDGFQGVQLTEKEVRQLASAAEFLEKTFNNSDELVVEIENQIIDNLLPVELLSANDKLFQMEVDSEVIWVHLLDKSTLGYKLGFRGAITDTVVRTKREYELSKYMLPKKVEDRSMFVASPMPGVIVSLAVKPGDKVEIGQEIGVIEAMKMHNSIRAEKSAVIADVVVATGDSVDVDQKLLIYAEDE